MLNCIIYHTGLTDLVLGNQLFVFGSYLLRIPVSVLIRLSWLGNLCVVFISKHISALTSTFTTKYHSRCSTIVRPTCLNNYPQIRLAIIYNLNLTLLAII